MLVDSNKVKSIFRLLIFLLILENSADFDGWRKLIKRNEKKIIFFEISEINLKIQLQILVLRTF